MVNQKFYQLGTAPSVIRELFAYGLEQAKTVGPENVFDYSLGNPSIPAPAKVNQSIHDILNDTDSIKVHGYSMACGFDSAREAIAANLNRRFGTDLKAGNLFLTCGAAPGLIAVIRPCWRRRTPRSWRWPPSSRNTGPLPSPTAVIWWWCRQTLMRSRSTWTRWSAA